MSNSFREVYSNCILLFYICILLEQGISLNEGSITGVVNVEDFEGPLQGKSFVHLLQEIIQANVYVNVHTKSQKEEK